MTDIVFAAYTVVEDGIVLLENVEDQEIILPAADDKWMLHKDTENAPLPDQQAANKSTQRKGKGAHALSVAKELISDRANWYDIESSDDYNFPGIFTKPYPKHLGYCEDISKLPNYEASDPHFLYSDIQIGKGKARPKCLIETNIDGRSENVYYRFVPCGGVKRCAMYTDGCSYVVLTNEIKSCSQHPDSPLVCSGNCPVEFFYFWPENAKDMRRWLTRLVRTDMHESDLHNHPHHKEKKIPPIKVDMDVRRAVIENPHLKTLDLLTGMLYQPSSTINHN